MRREWARLCKEAGFTLDGDEIDVELSNQRRHRVLLEEESDALRLEGLVLSRAAVERVPDARMGAWLRNRTTQLVGFRLDERGRLVGESWVPKAGLSAAELATYLRQIAAECDRWEYLLTGRDTA